LTDEQGPAHKKTFFVKLKLGEEEFAASGASIKKAQHAAATVALEQTKYPHPIPKKPSNSSVDFNQTSSYVTNFV
jgi:double-stranded RNA-binding protein Staufen